MRQVTRYLADDGREFTTQAQCLSYETALQIAQAIHELLGAPANRREVQRDPECCREARGVFQDGLGDYLLNNYSDVHARMEAALHDVDADFGQRAGAFYELCRRSEEGADAVIDVYRRLLARLDCISTKSWKEYQFPHIKALEDGTHSLLRGE